MFASDVFVGISCFSDRLEVSVPLEGASSSIEPYVEKELACFQRLIDIVLVDPNQIDSGALWSRAGPLGTSSRGKNTTHQNTIC